MSVLTIGKLSGGWFIATMIAVYFTWGSMFSLFPAIIGDYFGANHATSNYGFLYTAKGVASIGGGWIAAKMFEKFGNWNADFYGTAASGVALRRSDSCGQIHAAPGQARRRRTCDGGRQSQLETLRQTAKGRGVLLRPLLWLRKPVIRSAA